VLTFQVLFELVETPSILSQQKEKLTVGNQAARSFLASMTIGLFNVNTFVFLLLLSFLPLVKKVVGVSYIDWCSPTTPYST
jgi:hypothetical protein